MGRRFIARRKPVEIEIELWEGPGDYEIPAIHTLHGTRLFVEPLNFIAKPNSGDWYPLHRDVLRDTFEIIGELE